MSTLTTIRAFLAAQIEVDGPPSIEEVAAKLNVSKSTARERLKTCVENGLLEQDIGRQRGYRLTDLGKRIA